MLLLLVPCLMAAVTLHSADSAVGPSQDKLPVLAVIAPLDFELSPLLDSLDDLTRRDISGIRFWTGAFSDRCRLVLTICGTGKVNTAMATTLLVREYRPDVVIMIGTAGALTESLQPGDVCISSAVCHHDMGVTMHYGVMHRGFRSPEKGKRTPVVLDADAQLVSLAKRVAVGSNLAMIEGSEHQPIVQTATIACGDTFMACPKSAKRIAEELDAQAIEMEGAAMAQVCSQFSTKWIAIRGISDSSLDAGSGRSFLRNGHPAARNAAAVARALIEELSTNHTLR